MCQIKKIPRICTHTQMYLYLWCMCCSVLQCVAVCCSAFQNPRMSTPTVEIQFSKVSLLPKILYKMTAELPFENFFQQAATGSQWLPCVLQCVAVWYSVLQCGAECCSVL